MNIIHALTTTFNGKSRAPQTKGAHLRRSCRAKVRFQAVATFAVFLECCGRPTRKDVLRARDSTNRSARIPTPPVRRCPRDGPGNQAGRALGSGSGWCLLPSHPARGSLAHPVCMWTRERLRPRWTSWALEQHPLGRLETQPPRASHAALSKQSVGGTGSSHALRIAPTWRVERMPPRSAGGTYRFANRGNCAGAQRA